MKKILPCRTKPWRSVVLIFYFSIFNYQFSIAQNPLVKQWDYRFGGVTNDHFFSFQQTFDNGYILGGFSISDSGGDKTQNTWHNTLGLSTYDYWIVKIDSLGNKQWDKDFGGTASDELISLQQTVDGGYILGGNSFSDSSGNKTQDSWGGMDYWVIKTDSSGNKQWDKNFGGTSDDHFYSLQQTFDGGYILGGYSNSNVSGDKTQPPWNFSEDFWIVKIDSLGNKQWDKVLGGINDDYLYSLQQTNDGGYILGGSSYSDSTGDKTQTNWDTSGFTFDYWIIKTDSSGNKQWDKVFGGTANDVFYSLQQTIDGGYVLGGTSWSGISGNKTQPNWDTTLLTNDYWIVKTDSLGNKQWDKRFGGTFSEDVFGNVSLTKDSGYLIAGISYSDISGDKTEDNLGPEQLWVLKLDSTGDKQWDKTIFTQSEDEIGFALQIKDGCYVAANWTESGIGGYKTQPSWGGWDYWIIKFCDSTATTSIDTNSNSQIPISIYPNPAKEYFIINYHFKAGDEIQLTDVLGKHLFTIKITTPTLNFKLQTLNLPFGIYFLKAGSEVKKFVKE